MRLYAPLAPPSFLERTARVCPGKLGVAHGARGFTWAETCGPPTVCATHEEWKDLDVGRRAERNGRQGVCYVGQEGLTVMDGETMGR